MSEQRIDDSAAAASAVDADPTEGQGLQNAAAHPGGLLGGMAGNTSDAAVPHDEDRQATGGGDTPATEGFRSVAETVERAPDQPGA
ncbi:MAG: hypothetical protein M3P91_04325 [Actinomycetota bacterium]|nr:hypothetical protein [Actinomycetota bacterium]